MKLNNKKKSILKGKDIISFGQLDTKALSMIFKTANKMKKTFTNKQTRELLKDKIVTLLFFEPSSRTFSSFAAAAKRLGAQTIEYQNPMQTSSAVKGETLEDTIKVFSVYSDLIIMRHPEIGAAEKAANATETPIINAGDGSSEHPTQALLDLYTMLNKFDRLSHLKGVIAGDLLYGRTVHSLLKGLSLYPGNTIYLLSPQRLQLPRELFNLISKKINLIEISNENQIPENCNFWYWTRVQKERFSNLKEYEKIKHSFVINPELLKKKGGKQTIIMHPLPRVGEIHAAIDSDPRAVYLTEQIRNGLYVRMALLNLILR